MTKEKNERANGYQSDAQRVSIYLSHPGFLHLLNIMYSYFLPLLFFILPGRQHSTLEDVGVDYANFVKTNEISPYPYLSAPFGYREASSSGRWCFEMLYVNGSITAHKCYHRWHSHPRPHHPPLQRHPQKTPHR